MSTVSTLPRRSQATSEDATTENGARFDALVRSVVPLQRSAGAHDGAADEARDAQAGEGLETVFDLDYGQHRIESLAPARGPQTLRRVRVAAPAQERPAPSPRVRLTHRGRVLGTLVFLGAALALMTAMGGWAAASLSGGSPEPVSVVVVQPGDTLYEIAADVAEPGQIRTMVHRIQELNSLPGAQITEGQKLAVPRG